MNKIIEKLKDLEQERNSIIRCQEQLRDKMKNENGDTYIKLMQTYKDNKKELEEVNRKIQILNETIDIVENI